MLIKDYLGVEDYSESIAYTYRTGLTGHLTAEEWCKMFRKADKKYMMEPDDYKIYCELPDIVTAYRGSTVSGSVKDAARRLSWSLDKDHSTWFAEREYATFNKEHAVLMKAEIPKDKIFMYADKEHEVVVDVLEYDIPFEIVTDYK